MLETDSEGYVRGFTTMSQSDYFAAKVGKHPALSSSLAKHIVNGCPEDAWRISQREWETEDEDEDSTEAKDGGNVLDRLMTGDELPPPTIECVDEVRAQGKGKKPLAAVMCGFWNGLCVVDVDKWSGASAKLAKQAARANGYTPIKLSEYEKAVRQLTTIRVRLELAGVDLSQSQKQVVMYWVEYALDGTPVQCRGMMDYFDPDASANGFKIIRDLKRVKSLREASIERSMTDYGWAMQCAAYSSGVAALTDANTAYRWVFVRTYPVVACFERGPSGALLAVGQAEWQYSINCWARGTVSGLWDGWESKTEPIEATQWQRDRADAFGVEAP